MLGVLNINKPVGWTSRDVVNRVQRFVRPAKAGHAGTLDPLATGVLVVCIGRATKLITRIQELPKSYRATFLLGRASSSDDTETEVTEVSDAATPSLTDIQALLPKFLGQISQRPPAYSAIKIQGQRAYKLARQGVDLKMKPRTVQIYDLKIESYDHPELKMTMRCGSGTYVRSLGRDLAESLGTGAVMSALERTAIGDFCVTDAEDIEQLDRETIEAKILPPLSAVESLPRLELSESQWFELQHGRRIAMAEAGVTPTSSDEIFAAVNSHGELVALVSERRPGLLGTVCNLSLPQ